MGDSEEETGGLDPHPAPEKSQNIGFPSNIDPEPQKITKLPSQHSMVGHYWHASFAGGPMMAHFLWHFDPLSILSTKKKEKKIRTLSVLDTL